MNFRKQGYFIAESMVALLLLGLLFSTLFTGIARQTQLDRQMALQQEALILLGNIQVRRAATPARSLEALIDEEFALSGLHVKPELRPRWERIAGRSLLRIESPSYRLDVRAEVQP